uniref:Uncharacterized protein n=1 Tax=Anguilla anguilla TaxID=7936 RepID=A0A0E9VCE9_ANGAN
MPFLKVHFPTTMLNSGQVKVKTNLRLGQNKPYSSSIPRYFCCGHYPNTQCFPSSSSQSSSSPSSSSSSSSGDPALP